MVTATCMLNGDTGTERTCCIEEIIVAKIINRVLT